MGARTGTGTLAGTRGGTANAYGCTSALGLKLTVCESTDPIFRVLIVPA
eukprot:SAG31_NODE_854_length_11497_cov_8.245043_6_plen_49_part_00